MVKKATGKKHTAVIHLADGDVIEVIDDDGNKAPKKDAAPNGKIKEIKFIAWLEMQTEDPNPACFVQFNGQWFRIC